MTDYGLTPQGFVPKPVDAIKADMEADLRGQFGPSINLESHTVFGQLVGLMSERHGSLWDALQDVYASMYPDTATGASLVDVCALTGTIPDPALKTKVVATLSGTPGTVIPAGKVVGVPNVGTRFVTTADATIGAGGTVDTEVEAEEYGPLSCYAGTLTEIVTPLFGWDAVTNDADHFLLGTNAPTDDVIRAQREDELAAGGKSTIDAIRADVLKVDGVTSCVVFENTTDVANGDGMPPHSVEVLVKGGADDSVAAAVWASKPGGIETFGTIEREVEGADGRLHIVAFTRPTIRSLYVYAAIRVTTDYPIDGDYKVKEAIVAWADANYAIGRDAHASHLYGPVFSVPGVDYVQAILFDAVAPVDPLLGENYIGISSRQQADLDTARIQVVHV